MPRFPQPQTSIKSARTNYRFYFGDCLEVLDCLHPATFPPRLPEMCLRLHGLDRIRTVPDPFLGLGSTAVACAQLGVNFGGIEMDQGNSREPVDCTRIALNKTV